MWHWALKLANACPSLLLQIDPCRQLKLPVSCFVALNHVVVAKAFQILLFLFIELSHLTEYSAF